MAKKYYLNEHGLVTYNELIKKKISELVGFEVKVVDSLPLSGKEHILYLVPNTLDPNIHDEYLWVDEKWELIGSTTINLNDYYTKEEIDSSINVIDSSIKNISINALNDSLIVNNSSISFNSDTSYIHLSASDNKLLLNSSIITLADASDGLTGLAIALDVYDELVNVEKVIATAQILVANKVGLDSSLNLSWSEESGLTEDTIKEAIEYVSINAGAKINDSSINVTETWSSLKVNNEILTVKGTPYLKFTANTAGSTIALSNYGENAPDIKYSRDGINWIQWDYSAITLTNADDYVYMKGNNSQGFSSSNSKYSQFVMTGSIASSGNIMSLIDNGACQTLTIPSSYCYYSMFLDCSSLTSAPELPATTLASGCYRDMFFNCSSLTSAPELPATTLAMSCYHNMFNGCSSLTSAPELPATTLVSGCYYSMFYNCSSLTSAPELPATTLVSWCYEGMFYNCSRLSYIKCLATTGINENNSTTYWISGVASTGTFIKDSNAAWPTGVNGIPIGWNYINLSATQTYENGHIYDSSVNSIAEGVLNGSLGGIAVNQSVASGINSHAEGNSTAFGINSHAEGNSTAFGPNSHAEGRSSFANGEYSHAEGSNCICDGSISHVEGVSNTTINEGEHAEGKYNITIYQKSIHTVGVGKKENDTITRMNGHLIDVDGKHYIPGIGGYHGTETNFTNIKDLATVIEEIPIEKGTGTGSAQQKGATASGQYSFAEGGSTSKASRSHAEGNGCIAETTATNSHVEGYQNTVNGVASHAEGRNNTTTNEAEHAEGKYNLSHTNTIHSIGIGSNSTRMNAVEVLNTGDVYINGIGNYEGIDINDQNSNIKPILDVVVQSETVLKLWSGTQAEYDAIAVKDNATLYLIKD